jgi:hypothetical protein
MRENPPGAYRVLCFSGLGRLHCAMLLVLVLLLGTGRALAQGLDGYANFEAPPVRPIAVGELGGRGSRLCLQHGGQRLGDL